MNASDNAGWTPLHEACNHGYGEITRLLLKAGAKVGPKATEVSAEDRSWVWSASCRGRQAVQRCPFLSVRIAFLVHSPFQGRCTRHG